MKSFGVSSVAGLLTLFISSSVQSSILDVSYTTLDVPGAAWTQAHDFDGSNIVGSSSSHGFVYDGLSFRELDSPLRYAHGIDGDNIVGYTGDGNGFLYDGTDYTIITVPGAYRTKAKDISGGNIVGWYEEHRSDPGHGFLYDGTSYTTFDVPGVDGYTQAYGVDGTNIVGEVNIGSKTHGFLYDGVNYTIFTVPDAEDTNARGINGATIVGRFYSGGSYHGFRATIPEPVPGPVIGDLNYDGVADNLDFTPFLIALTVGGHEEAFLAEVPGGKFYHGDVDHDGFVNNTDITPFIGLLTAAGSNATAVPEPSSLVCVVLTLMMGRRRRRT